MENNFNSNLRRIRKEKGITQEQLAEAVGVSAQAVSKWEMSSYPDGELLPKVADFLGVSIDCLYGRAKDDSPVTQQIIDELQEIVFGSDNASDESIEKFFEQVFNYLWAVQTSAWKSSKYFYDRPRPDKSDGVTASETNNKSGFSFMRLNSDLEYYFIVKQPPDGFAKRLEATDEMAELFAFMGDKANLEIMQYMLSLKWEEAVRSRTIAKSLNLSVEKVEKALGFLCKSGNIFSNGKILEENNKSENMYMTNLIKAVAPIMIMICADTMINSPDNYNNQVGWNNAAWFNREDLAFNSKE